MFMIDFRMHAYKTEIVKIIIIYMMKNGNNYVQNMLK